MYFNKLQFELSVQGIVNSIILEVLQFNLVKLNCSISRIIELTIPCNSLV